jgi:hypothetical protein
MSCVHPEGKIAYVHIAKTGGTSIETFLKSIGWNGLKNTHFKKVHHVGFYRMKEVYPTLERAVTVVRNPVDRAISAYRHFVHLQRLRADENHCAKQIMRLKRLEKGFLPWINEYSFTVKRWTSIHTPQLHFIRDSGSFANSEDCGPTRVFDYADRTNFWQYTCGFVPKEQTKNKMLNVDPVVLTQTERDTVMEKFKTDYKVWGNQFNWH